MTFLLKNNLNIFRRFVDINTSQTFQLHQLAARLTAPHPPKSSSPEPGAPVLNCASPSSPALIGGGWSFLSVRHGVRNNFPRPREKKRLMASWEERMKTHGGRLILMRRVLKGRWYIGQPPSMLPHWRHKQF